MKALSIESLLNENEDLKKQKAKLIEENERLRKLIEDASKQCRYHFLEVGIENR